ncbi:uncharacterized protein LOC134031398 [Osmerus eperlanus]|uniref:uncharacterized protein LOC134031343 n=1 Tax=Osmerus eperlanus TaxID=29151 RepID=UPI002E1073D7
MSKIRTLNEIGQLESSGYGVPWPRHGLHLLYWFCNDYVSFDNNGDLVALEHPKTEHFGFHWFGNRLEDDGYQLLPGIDIPYYEVGNLFFQGADDLPDDVWSNFTEEDHHSNMDRIIISIYPDREVHKVYVTQHHGEVGFDRQNTFCISKGLVRIIRNLDLEDGLLWQVGYRSKTKSSRNLQMNRPSYLLPYTETPREPAVAQTCVPQSRGGRSPGGGERELRNDRPERICNCVIL